MALVAVLALGLQTALHDYYLVTHVDMLTSVYVLTVLPGLLLLLLIPPTATTTTTSTAINTYLPTLLSTNLCTHTHR